nr:DUF5627 domain-containing protein [uncultured Draconibacterium sp.]
MKKNIFIFFMVALLFTSCHNQDWEFKDYDYTTVYFAYQRPVRTIVLGKDIYDNSLDNEHKCKIMATMGGVYDNNEDRIVDLSIDNSLCDNLKFESGEEVLPMPSDYYSLEDEMQIVIPGGAKVGGIVVELSDAFFTDSASVGNTYVIPLRITNVTNVDSVLSGKASVSNPDLVVDGDWEIVPKNYILYCVKYINSWDGKYLRRGKDVGVAKAGEDPSLSITNVYHADYIEADQVVSMKTVSLNQVAMDLTTRNGNSDLNIPFQIRLNFNDEGVATVTAPVNSDYAVRGSAKYVEDADMWGGKERDVIYLDYNIDFGATVHSFTDTLVMRDRGVVKEEFGIE